jgi:hypothetical protein
MATTAGSIAAFPLRNAKNEAVILRGIFTIDATGVVTDSDVGDSGLTLVRQSAGAYAMTYPIAAGQRIFKCSLFHGGGGTPNISFCKMRSITASGAVFTTGTAALPFTAVDNTETSFQLQFELTLETTALR